MSKLLNELDERIAKMDDLNLVEKEKLCLEYAKKGVVEAYSYIADIYYFDKEDLNQALKVLGYKLSDELLKLDKEQQKALIDNYVKAFALQYDLEEFK